MNKRERKSRSKSGKRRGKDRWRWNWNKRWCNRKRLIWKNKKSMKTSPWIQIRPTQRRRILKSKVSRIIKWQRSNYKRKSKEKGRGTEKIEREKRKDRICLNKIIWINSRSRRNRFSIPKLLKIRSKHLKMRLKILGKIK